MPTILNDFLRIVRKYPNSTAITHCLSKVLETKITFAELDQRSDELAAHLNAQSISSGDFIGVYMARSIDHVAAILGILKTGAAFYSLNTRSTIEQVAHAVRLSHAPNLLIDYGTLINLQNVDKAKGAITSIILYSSKAPTSFHKELIENIRKTISMAQLIPTNSAGGQTPLSRNIVPHDVAMVLFTSGSTGNPKGVLISHQDLYNRTHTECEYYEITNEDVLLNLLPFSFDVGANQLFTALSTGAQLSILNSWMPADIISVVQKHRVVGISAVPAIWASFLSLPKNEEAFQIIDSVRYITISGGDLAPDQLKRLGENLHKTKIYKTYGQTETFRSALLLPSEYQNKMLSVGRPVRGTRVIIVNSRGERAAANEAGEIIHSGDGTMLGYLGDARETSRKVRPTPIKGKKSPYQQRVVFTGDIGKVDHEGYLYILGRKDRMIKSSGYRIYPKEIYDQILRHSSVQEAVVFGIPDKNIGKAIWAEVQLKQGMEMKEDELKRFLSDKLPQYMIPSRIMFVPDFPRTPSGKIRLSEVEAKYRE